MRPPRDLTNAQFRRALSEHGFQQVFGWIEDTTGQCPGISWGASIIAGSGAIARRATLARVLREREVEVTKGGMVSAARLAAGIDPRSSSV